MTLTDVTYTIWATKPCAGMNQNWKKKKICFGSSVMWELIYLILSFATVVCSFLVDEMKVNILPFKLLHAVFWLRKGFAGVIKKDQGNVGLVQCLFFSVSPQSGMICKWSGGLTYFSADVKSIKPSQVAVVFQSVWGKGKAKVQKLRNEVGPHWSWAHIAKITWLSAMK